MIRPGHISTYLLVFFLIILGVLFYLFRDDLFFQAEKYLVDDPPLKEVTLSADKVEKIIDLEIFNDDRLESMEKTAPYFNFNKAGRIAPVGMEDSDLPIFAPVFLGNNQPFK